MHILIYIQVTTNIIFFKCISAYLRVFQLYTDDAAWFSPFSARVYGSKVDRNPWLAKMVAPGLKKKIECPRSSIRIFPDWGLQICIYHIILVYIYIYNCTEYSRGQKNPGVRVFISYGGGRVGGHQSRPSTTSWKPF